MKTILYGAFGRHNFGDMLFPHIVHKLIKENIDESEIEFCDVVSRNMVEFGGHNIKSIADFIDYTEAVCNSCRWRNRKLHSWRSFTYVQPFKFYK